MDGCLDAPPYGFIKTAFYWEWMKASNIVINYIFPNFSLISKILQILFFILNSFRKLLKFFDI